MVTSSKAAKISTPTVLVVDDEGLIRWSLRTGLAGAGFGVEEAADAATALRFLRDRPEPFSAIILDYRLPDRRDLSLLREIRHASPGTPVIMMTAFAEDLMRTEALAVGVLDVVDKPFQVASMIARVRAAVSSHS